jgi:hypothetical protein
MAGLSETTKAEIRKNLPDALEYIAQLFDQGVRDMERCLEDPTVSAPQRLSYRGIRVENLYAAEHIRTAAKAVP